MFMVLISGCKDKAGFWSGISMARFSRVLLVRGWFLHLLYGIWIIRLSLFLSLLESLMVGSDRYARFMVGDSLLFLMFVSAE